MESTNNVQLDYGLHDGRIRLISEVPIEERGLSCNCSCPNCGERLIARMGEKRQWHFAHKGSACDISAAKQTALHMIAKELIEDYKVILFPGITVTRDECVDSSLDWRVRSRLPGTMEYKKASARKCESVVLEKKVSTIIPDIVVKTGNRECLIEIAVTHFVDKEKECRIQEIGLPVLEIDLSDYYDTHFTRDEIKKAVLQDESNRKWIYNPLFSKAKKWASAEFEKLISSIQAEIERADQEARLKEEKRQQKREDGEKKIQLLFRPDIYKKAIADLSNDQKVTQHIETLHFQTDLEHFPFFLNIPISGEPVFPCDRRIWQSSLFDKFVYHRNTKDNGKPSIQIKRVQKWICQYNTAFPVNWTLSYKTKVQMPSGEGRTVTLLYDVVLTFLNYLGYLGFIDSFSFQEAAILQSHSVIPPNAEHAKTLYAALNEVEWNSPDVDEQVRIAVAQRDAQVFQSGFMYFDPNVNYSRSKLACCKQLLADETSCKVAEEQREKTEAEEIQKGYQEITSIINQQDTPVYDSFKRRWVRCEYCGCIKLGSEFVSYGGRDHSNLGTCRDCSKIENKGKC